MPLIEKVLGCCDYSENLAVFPYLATPKIDGIRGYTKNGIVYAKSNKPIPNCFVQNRIPKILGDGFDFEMQVKDFNTTTSVVMADAVDIEDLHIHIFDYVSPDHKIQPYIARCAYLHRLQPNLPQNYHTLLPFVIRDDRQLHTYFEQCLQAGHEGIVLRKPEGTYKFGKSTQLEQYLMRVTANATSEAIIIGFKELMLNANPSIVGPNGRSKKSKTIDGQRPSGRLGSFTVRDLHTEVVFDLTASNGLTDQDREKIWATQSDYRNRIVKYSYKAHGTIDKPRQPKFEGFRDPIDMSEELLRNLE